MSLRVLETREDSHHYEPLLVMALTRCSRQTPRCLFPSSECSGVGVKHRVHVLNDQEIGNECSEDPEHGFICPRGLVLRRFDGIGLIMPR